MKSLWTESKRSGRSIKRTRSQPSCCRDSIWPWQRSSRDEQDRLARSGVWSSLTRICEFCRSSLPLCAINRCERRNASTPTRRSAGLRPPSGFLDCQKSRTGMLLQPAEALKIDLAKSFMIGDRWQDVDCGFNAGCKTVFVDWGYQETRKRQPDYRAGNLLEAVKLIQTLTL